MAGHSHWANIAHKKGIADAKRGKVWSKLSRAIIIAARHGGGDPETNLKLRYAIDKARAVSMPKDNIERAIKRGTGELAGDAMEEWSYEGYGPGGAAILVDVMSDNRNRTNGEVRKLFERGGGNLGSPGCVAYLFERKGVFTVDADTIAEDTLLGVALDSGADDVRRQGAAYEIVCDPTAFDAVKANLEKAGVKLTSAEITKVPKTSVDVDAETGQKVFRLLDSLDDHDDVQNVYSNVNLTEEMVSGA
jgi:YebC/PmpR family DNA-binding regulatory protein